MAIVAVDPDKPLAISVRSLLAGYAIECPRQPLKGYILISLAYWTACKIYNISIYIKIGYVLVL